MFSLKLEKYNIYFSSYRITKKYSNFILMNTKRIYFELIIKDKRIKYNFDFKYNKISV